MPFLHVKDPYFIASKPFDENSDNAGDMFVSYMHTSFDSENIKKMLKKKDETRAGIKQAYAALKKNSSPAMVNLIITSTVIFFIVVVYFILGSMYYSLRPDYFFRFMIIIVAITALVSSARWFSIL